MAAGRPNEAIQMLASRAGAENIALASKIARITNDPLALALSVAHGMRAQSLSEWNVAKDEFIAHDELKYVDFIIIINYLVFNCIYSFFRVYVFILGVERTLVNYYSQYSSASKLPRIEQLSDIEDLKSFPKCIYLLILFYYYLI